MTYSFCRTVGSNITTPSTGLLRQWRYYTNHAKLDPYKPTANSTTRASNRNLNSDQLWQEIHSLESHLGLTQTKRDGRWREKRLLGKAATLFEQRMCKTSTQPEPDTSATSNAPPTPLLERLYHDSFNERSKLATQLPPKSFLTTRPTWSLSKVQKSQKIPGKEVKPPEKASDQGFKKSTRSYKDMEPWQIQKAALKEKFKNEPWAPRKRLSPDTIDGIRMLHKSDPEAYPTHVLSKQFEVSPEAIRRILRSKWIPNEEEAEDRRERWERRGEKIWSSKVEMGLRPPKKWREMGVGRVGPGETPTWKRKRKSKPEHVPWDNRSFGPDDGSIHQEKSVSDQIL